MEKEVSKEGMCKTWTYYTNNGIMSKRIKEKNKEVPMTKKPLKQLKEELKEIRKTKWRAFYLVKKYYADKNKDLSILLNAIEQEDNTLNQIALFTEL